jgi:hypothetical protein
MTRAARCAGVLVAIGGVFLGVPAPVAAQTQCSVPSFGLPRAVGTAGESPFRIVSADFNGDARPDVATAGQDGAAVLLGDGAGAFGPATFFARPDTLDVVAADFSGDGDLDLAVSWKQPGPSGLVGAIDVRLGDGAGAFGPPASFAAGHEPRAMVAVDFDANGTIDIAAADAAGRRMLVLSGDGSGGFAAPINVPVPGAANAITSGHFNADAHMDFAVGLLDEAALNGDTLVSLLGNGSGGFMAMPPANAGGIDAIVPTDFNLDGEVDLVVVHRGPPPPSPPSSHLAFIVGDGAGHFGRVAGSLLGREGTDIKSADLDGDGRGDLVARAVNGFYGVGILQVIVPRPFPMPFDSASYGLPTEDPGGVALADFDLDGRIDAVTLGTTPGGNLIVMLNKCGDVADASVDAVRSPEAPIAGEQITYTITARNAGPAPVEAYLRLFVSSHADLRALETTALCANEVPAPNNSAVLVCDLRTLVPGHEVTLTARVVGRGRGGIVRVSAELVTTVPDPDLANNEVLNEVRTRVIGGRELTVSAAPGGGTLLQWSGGEVQAGYFVRRVIDGVVTTFPADGVPFPAGTMTFTDPSPVPARSNCYFITPVTTQASPLGRSGLACRVPDTASGGGPDTASLKLQPSNSVDLAWVGPSAATGYVVWSKRTDTGETSTVTTAGTGYGFAPSAPTCYAVVAYQQTTQLGNTDLFCVVPGFSTLPH